MLKSEWKYLITHKMVLVVLVAIAMIPAIYCFIYLSSMWNTYGKMADLPVAIVNHDQPVNYQGKHIAIGQNLTRNLVHSDSLDFHHVSAAKAAHQLKAGHYYMVLTVPKHFSKDATTILGAHPKTMPLYFRFNSGQNFIVSKMTSGAATAIKGKVSAQVTKLYAGIVLKAVGSAETGMQQAATGGAALAQGATSMLTGETQLHDGLQAMISGFNTVVIDNQTTGGALQANTAKLTTGTASLTQGTQKILAGSQTLAASLATGAQKLQTIHTASANAQAMAAPVKEVTSDIAKIPNNGTGMAPFAIAIGLYVGGIALGTMYEAFLPHQKPKHALTWWGSKASVVGLVGLLQAALLYGSLMQGNHLQVSNHGLFFLVILLGSWLFVSLIFCLRLLLGGFGTWLVSIVLVLQLASSGGLYPTFLVNHFAQSLNAWLPMTYLINALRAVISTHQSIASDLWIMLLITLALNIAMILRFQLGLRQDVIIIDD